MTDNPLDVADLRDRIDKALAEFVAARVPVLEAVAEELGALSDAIAEFLLDGGKRLRPAFCYWGWRAAGGADSDAIVRAAAALEILHACALIHDDVMDGSETRRGRPAVHRRFAALHRGEAWRGSPESFGAAAAILLGNMCLIWSDQMLHSAALDDDALRRARSTYDEMRVELMAGQYLDILESALGGASVERALRVARYKSGRYTIERPLRLGAELAGASTSALSTLARYGLPLGDAFQLRDDVLGVFGDPAETGKPAGDDLREGKRTVLVAMAVQRATPAQAAVVRRHLGDPHLDTDGVVRLREVITDTGALAAVEDLVAELTAQALGALDAADLPTEPESMLRRLAVAATARRG
ncbi:MAG: polyprenyl synthetase family protein [Frankia sp.]|nr:polyprenyl synthetase family protein [Frankia sp.]